MSRLILIEIFADRRAGHWGDNLVRMCKGAREIGLDPVAVCPRGVHPELLYDLQATGTKVIERPQRRAFVARLFLRFAYVVLRCHSPLSRFRFLTIWAEHLQSIAHALAETGALKVVRRELRETRFVDEATVVILSATGAFGPAVARIGGCHHVRFVHSGVRPSRVLRPLDNLTNRWANRVVDVCTTDAVARAVAEREPGVRTTLCSYTVADPTMYLDSGERERARRKLGIDSDEFTISLVGGWWAYKDMDTIRDALGSARLAVTVIVGGKPTWPERLVPAVMRSGGRIVDLSGALSAEQVRQVYAAADVAIVSRVSGFDGESGIVYDAVRYGIPLLLSDHDGKTTARFQGEPWVRVFPPGDGAALAQLLDDLHRDPLPRPDRSSAQRVGLRTASELAASLAGLLSDST